MRIDDYCHHVITSTKLAATAQAVLWAIAYHVNRKTGETFVALPTIAEETNIAARRVRHHAGELAAAGVFHVQHRPGRTSIYRFPLHPALSTPSPPETAVAGDKSYREKPGGVPPETADPYREKPTNQVPNQVHNRAAIDSTAVDPTPAWFSERRERMRGAS